MSTTPPYIESLYKTMGSIMTEKAAELSFWHKRLMDAYAGSDTVSAGSVQKTVMEIYASTLYALISVSAFFRADFRSSIVVEKRINLKYLCFVTTEFYKAVFLIGKKRSLWEQFKSFLEMSDSTSIHQEINKIELAAEEFKKNFLNAENRNISLHYDFDLNLLYKHLCVISEEFESRHVSAFLAIAQPLTFLCKSSLIVFGIDGNEILPTQENVRDKIIRSKLYNEVYPLIGKTTESFSKSIDSSMRSYQIVDRPQISNLLGSKEVEHIKKFRECILPGALLHYVYLDLGAAVQGYLSSDTFYEQQLHLARINVIIYEGYNKIYSDRNGTSLWTKYIKKPIYALGNREDITEVEKIEGTLSAYSQDKDIKNLRHKYCHFKKDKKLYLVELWDELQQLIPFVELNKAQQFLKLIARIIKLSKKSLSYFAEEDKRRTDEKLLAPLREKIGSLLKSL